MIDTKSFKIVSKLFNDVQQNSRMVGLVASPGNGKSTMIHECCKHDYTRISVSMAKSKKPIHIYKDIYQKLRPGARVVPNDMYDLIYESSKFLSASEKKYMIALDESGKFKSTTLEYFHEFRDNTREKCGFIFAGPPSWKKNLSAWVEDERQGMEEFARRVDEWVLLDNPTKSEKSLYCKDRGIHEITLIEKLVGSSETFSDLVIAVDSYLRSN